MNRPKLSRKGAYKPQEESYCEAQNEEAAIPRCVSVDSLRIGAQDKWFLNSYWRKSEQMFPKALLSSVGQSFPSFPSLQGWSLTALAPSSGYPKGSSPACSYGIVCHKTLSPTQLFSLSQAGCGRVGHNTVLNNSYN